MKNSEKISVIKNNAEFKLKIKGSQFIGYAYKISNIDDAANHIAALKKEFYDATHHCYAYKIKNGEEKYSDDGEPNGTAGIRIFNAINHFHITDILIVVVRYFGGTKLGVGPLGKAYGETAMSLLNNTEIVELIKYEKMIISYSYGYVSAIHYLLKKYKCRKINNIYDNSPVIECYIEPFHTKFFRQEITEKTSGNCTIKLINEQIYLTLN